MISKIFRRESLFLYGVGLRADVSCLEHLGENSMHLWVTPTQDFCSFRNKFSILTWPWTWCEDPCEANTCTICQAYGANMSVFSYNEVSVLTPLHVSDFGKPPEDPSGSYRRGPWRTRSSFGVAPI